MHGVMIYDIDNRRQDNVSFGNKADIIETRLPRRIQPIHYGVNYNNDPLQFKLIFGAHDYLDRYDLEALSLWLTGHQEYKWLSICQKDLHVEYRCLIRELTPISIAWLPIAFEATVICDCPYAYGYEFSETYTLSGSRTVVFRNDSSVRDYLKPTLVYAATGDAVTTLSIINHSDNDREFKIEDIPAGAEVTIDNNNGIITALRAMDFWHTGINYTAGNCVKMISLDEDGGVKYYRCKQSHASTAYNSPYQNTTLWEEITYDKTMYNLYGGYNMNSLRLVPGDNILEISGNGSLTMSGRTLHNVSA